MKKVYLTEKQSEYIRESVRYDIDPRKVGVVKAYLDKAFTRGAMSTVNEKGYPESVKIVGMIGSDGNVVRNMTAKQLFYLLQDRFSKISDDKKIRDNFLKKVITDWWEKRIDPNGLMSVNSIDV